MMVVICKKQGRGKKGEQREKGEKGRLEKKRCKRSCTVFSLLLFLETVNRLTIGPIVVFRLYWGLLFWVFKFRTLWPIFAQLDIRSVSIGLWRFHWCIAWTCSSIIDRFMLMRYNHGTGVIFALFETENVPDCPKVFLFIINGLLSVLLAQFQPLNAGFCHSANTHERRPKRRV